MRSFKSSNQNSTSLHSIYLLSSVDTEIEGFLWRERLLSQFLLHSLTPSVLPLLTFSWTQGCQAESWWYEHTLIVRNWLCIWSKFVARVSFDSLCAIIACTTWILDLPAIFCRSADPSQEQNITMTEITDWAQMWSKYLVLVTSRRVRGKCIWELVSNTAASKQDWLYL